MGVDPGQDCLVVRSGQNFPFQFGGIKPGKFEEPSVQRIKSGSRIAASQKVGTIFRRQSVSGSQSDLVDQTGEDGIASQPFSG